MKLCPWQGNETRQNTMASKLFTAKIVLPNGSVQEVTVSANNVFNAKELIKMQYGNPKFFSDPREVR